MKAAGALLLLTLVAGSNRQEDTSEALLSRIRAALVKVTAIYSEFDQERHMDLFEEPLRTEGVLVFKSPDSVRWETRRPNRSIVVSDGNSAAMFEGQEGGWKKLAVGFPDAMRNVMSKVSSVCRGRIEDLEQDYEASAKKTSEGVVLSLVPRSEKVRASISAIELKMRPDLSGAHEVMLKEPNGDYTRIRFRKEVRNPALPGKTFDLSEPTGLDRVRESVDGTPKGK